MRSLLADLRHAARVYLTTPLASFIAVAVLAVAIATAAAFLSLWSDLVLESKAGFEQSGRLVTVSQSDGRSIGRLALRFIETANDEVGALEALAGVMPIPQFLENENEREQLMTELVTAEFFAGMRPHLELGRGLRAGDHEPGAEPVVVLGYEYWQERFGSDPTVIGTTLPIAGPNIQVATPEGEANAADHTQEYRIVGIMGPSQTGTFGSDTQAWMPYEQAADTFFNTLGDMSTSITTLLGVARLAPDADVASLTAELRGRFGESDEELSLRPGRRFDVIGTLTSDASRHRDVERQVQLFLAGSLLIALVAGCNVSLFLLSRAPGRRRELGIRLAVGAPVRRIARQLATEAGLLVVVATLAGLLVSLWIAVLVQELPFLSGPFWRDASPFDWRVLVLVSGLAVLLTLLVALAPIAGLRKLGIAASARALTSNIGWGQHLAGTAQIAVAGVLGAAALAFGAYLAILTSADRGFDATGVHVVDVELARPGFDFDVEIDARIVERERRRALIEALPGISEVAFGTAVPGRDRPIFTGRVPRPGTSTPDSENIVVAPFDSTGHAFTEILEMSIVDGRGFEPSDREEVLINETLARELWGRTDVAGEIIRFGPEDGWPVVGVVGDAAYGHPAEEIEPRLMRRATPAAPMEQILVRGDITPASIRSELQRLIDAGEFDFEISSVDGIDELLATQLGADRARMRLTIAAAALVVVLAGFGFYGTQRYLVSVGRREHAIRAALGAGPRATGRFVIRRGLLLALPGLVLGVLLSFVLVAWLRGDFVSTAVSLYGVTLAVAFGLAGLVLAASFGPARRARRMQPGIVLREE